MGTRPLLYVCVRPQQDAAAGEYASFRAATGLSPESLESWDLVRAPLPDDALDRYAGFLIGGSPFNVTEPDKSAVQARVEADLARIAAAAREARTAAIFTCYGIGVVTRMMGGTVTLDRPESTQAAAVHLTDAGREDPILGALPDRFHAFTAHKEATERLPDDAVLLATNNDCPVQAYRIGDRLYATQFHPEPSPHDFAARMTFYRDAGYFDPAEFDAVAERVRASSVDAAALLHAFTRVFADA
ncbi:glutamine amidotransferase-related protein [Microbacterium caowuchunii]|uniref:GMP synthase n=1 Tax=Microbacterium caowuchunii TaxID=2614638 RepID=A0A5N0TGH7_9MICO|nr:GMP synthase [Microbacterium caowuchunii]KAA9132956.1 GMP synthase [Microbacterium caowuchunii]